MAKQKSVPDHKATSFKDNYKSPAETDMLDLKSKYDFMDDCDLRSGLEKIFKFEYLIRVSEENKTKASEQKKMLADLRDCSGWLKEIITNLGYQECSRLREAMPIGKTISLLTLEEDIGQLHSTSILALKAMDDVQGRKGKRANIWGFVERLADVWHEGTGKQPTVNFDSYSESYGGEFVAFVSDCAKLGSIELSLSGGDPGGTIRNIVREWKRR